MFSFENRVLCQVGSFLPLTYAQHWNFLKDFPYILAQEDAPGSHYMFLFQSSNTSFLSTPVFFFFFTEWYYKTLYVW